MSINWRNVSVFVLGTVFVGLLVYAGLIAFDGHETATMLVAGFGPVVGFALGSLIPVWFPWVTDVDDIREWEPPRIDRTP